MKNNRGAVLPTVVTLLFLTTFLLLSHSWTTRQQVIQLQMFQDSYRLKTMLVLSENRLKAHVKKGAIPETVTFEFTEGVVEAVYAAPTTYELTGTLMNGVSATRSLEIPESEAPETDEETTLPDGDTDTEKRLEEEASTEDQTATSLEREEETGEEVMEESDIIVEPPASHSNLGAFNGPDAAQSSD